jgi:hypothetical protein
VFLLYFFNFFDLVFGSSYDAHLCISQAIVLFFWYFFFFFFHYYFSHVLVISIEILDSASFVFFSHLELGQRQLRRHISKQTELDRLQSG